MPQKQLSNIDMAGLEILNMRFQNLVAAPGTNIGPGSVYFDTTAGKIMWRNASTWVDPLARTNHTGTIAPADVTGFDAQVQTSRLDQMAKPTASVDANAQKIINLATPTAAGDACTYGALQGWRLDQVAAPTAAVSLGNQKLTNVANGTAAQDGAAFGQIGSAVSTAVANLRLNTISASADVAFGGFKATGLANGTANQDACTYGQALAMVNGLQWKNPVRAATTAAITLSGTQTVDGVALAVNDRVLVKNQGGVNGTTHIANGLYTVQAGAWVRATDADAVGELTANTTVMIMEGTQSDTQWTVTTNGAVTPGTTAISFGQIGAATAYTADGVTLNLTGTTFSAKTDANGSLTRKYAQTIGDGTQLTYTITHSLATTDVTVTVRDAATGDKVYCDDRAATANTVVVGFVTAPAANAYRVIIQA